MTIQFIARLVERAGSPWTDALSRARGDGEPPSVAIKHTQTHAPIIGATPVWPERLGVTIVARGAASGHVG